MKIIAFTGAKGCGKDTVAEIVRRQCAADWGTVTQLAFADPIKTKILHLFNLNSTLEYDQFKRTDITFDIGGRQRTIAGRHLVREIGMMMRGYNSDQFNKYVEGHFERAIRLGGYKQLFLITDMRFDNEYTMLRNYGAKIVKVSRPDYKHDGHITERGFDDHLVDYHLHNDGSLTDLEDKTIQMLKELI